MGSLEPKYAEVKRILMDSLESKLLFNGQMEARGLGLTMTFSLSLVNFHVLFAVEYVQD